MIYNCRLLNSSLMKGSKHYGAVSFTINYLNMKQYNDPGANQFLQYILITIS